MTRFVRILSGPRLIGSHNYPAESVLAVDEVQASIMVRDGIAAHDNGPAFEPSPRKPRRTPQHEGD